MIYGLLQKGYLALEVDSTNLKEVLYDYKSKTLVIEFLKGNIYNYYNVPAEVAEGLQTAKSAGEYFHKYIKKYKAEKVI